MSIQKVEMTVEQKENGQYVEQVVYPFVEYDHVAMENGMDIMSMIRDDVTTPMVTHNTTSWKVGQGDSDVSETIVDSSVASMTIKGQTYENILPNPSLRNSMTNGKTMQKLNEGYDSVNTVDGVCKSAILSGQTLVNLFQNMDSVWGKYINQQQFNYVDGKLIFPYPSVWDGRNWKEVTAIENIKKNTVYTLLFTEGISPQVQIGTVNKNNIPSSLKTFFNVQKCVFNSPNNGDLRIKFCVGDEKNSSSIHLGEVMLLEGDYTNVDIPYFEGMQSVKMPVLTTNSYNLNGLYEIIKSNHTIEKTPVRYRVIHPGVNGYYSVTIATSEIFKITNSYTMNFRFIEKSDNVKVNINKSWNSGVYGFNPTFDTTEVQSYIFSPLIDNYTGSIFSIQLRGEQEKGSYIEFEFWITEGIEIKSNILTVNEPVELRGIGDVQDELNLTTGELTHRVGEIVLDGSEEWTISASTRPNHLRLYCRQPRFKQYQNVINDRFADNGNIQGRDIEGVYITNTVDIQVEHSRLSDVSVDAFKIWLSENPITIQARLSEKSIKTVDLSILDQDNQPTTQLNSFANGYIQVSSQGLIPTTEYEVPTSNSYHVDLAKPNTQYTMKNMQGTFTIDGIQYNASANGTFTSPSTLSNRLMITNVVQTQPMLLEGDMTSKEVPYVEGIKSTFEGVDRVEIVSQNADNTLSNTTSFQLTNPLRSLPNGVRDEIVLDRQNHKAHIIQRVGEDLTQLDTPIVTEVNLEGYPYVYKGGHIFLNTEIAPITEVTYSINQAHQIESSNEDILRHQKEINHLYGLIAQYVQVQYEAELIDIALQG